MQAAPKDRRPKAWDRSPLNWGFTFFGIRPNEEQLDVSFVRLYIRVLHQYSCVYIYMNHVKRYAFDLICTLFRNTSKKAALWNLL